MNARPLSYAVWFGREAMRYVREGDPKDAAAFARSAAHWAKKHLRAKAMSESALLRHASMKKALDRAHVRY